MLLGHRTPPAQLTHEAPGQVSSGECQSHPLRRRPTVVWLRFFRNWSEYVYKVERDATASAADASGPRNLTSKAGEADVRLTDTNAARPGVSDKFLLDNYADFATFADRVAGRMRQGAMGDAAGKEGPLVSMPKMTPADEAARTATTGTGAARPAGSTSRRASRRTARRR